MIWTECLQLQRNFQRATRNFTVSFLPCLPCLLAWINRHEAKVSFCTCSDTLHWHLWRVRWRQLGYPFVASWMKFGVVHFQLNTRYCVGSGRHLCRIVLALLDRTWCWQTLSRLRSTEVEVLRFCRNISFWGRYFRVSKKAAFRQIKGHVAKSRTKALVAIPLRQTWTRAADTSHRELSSMFYLYLQ